MKKLATLLLSVTLATVIVLPVASHINHSSTNRVLTAELPTRPASLRSNGQKHVRTAGLTSQTVRYALGPRVCYDEPLRRCT
jgi:hypothetical protein